MNLLTLATIWSIFMLALLSAGVAAVYGDAHWAVTLLLLAYVCVLNSRVLTVAAHQDRIDHQTGAWRRL